MSLPNGADPGATAHNPPTDTPPGIASGPYVAAEGINVPVDLTQEPQQKVRKRYIFGLVFTTLALYVAFVTPIAYSLQARVAQIDPAGKNGAAALAIAIPGIIVIFITPLVGVLSDRTRSRFGRRRPWFVGGLLLGLIGSVIVGTAPSVALVIVGWSIAYIGFSASGAMLITHQSDVLPEDQRGKVSGFGGAVTQIGPIAGILVASAFIKVPVAMFVVPAIFALVVGVVFSIVMKDKRLTAVIPSIDFKSLTKGFYFNPRRFPNVGWVWISRALVFLALSFSTTYGLYLVSQRLHISIGAAGPILATAGGLGIVTAILGAVLSGFLSDRLHSRKPFLVVAGVILAAGMVIVAFTQSEVQYLVGSAFGTFAVGIYSAVDQAIQLDVLPREQGQNGRFISILQLANQVPQAVGPLVAGGIIALAFGDYTAVYVIGGIVGILGALAIIPISVGRRAQDPTTNIKLPN